MVLACMIPLAGIPWFETFEDHIQCHPVIMFPVREPQKDSVYGAYWRVRGFRYQGSYYRKSGEKLYEVYEEEEFT